MSKLGSVKRNIMRNGIDEVNSLLSQYTRAQRKAELFKNGITLEGLDRAVREAHEKGWKQGYEAASERILKATYAGVALAMIERGMLSHDEVIDLLRQVDERVVNSILEDDLVDEVLEKTGIEIRFGDPIERVHEA